MLAYWGQLGGAWEFAEGSGAFWKQHYPRRTPEGNLLISTWVDSDNQEMVAREYEIDEENQVLREVWSCGQGSGTEAGAAGEAHRLPGGNTLHNYGSTARLREATPDGTVVWDVAWDRATFIGRSEVIADLYALWP